MHLKVLGSGSSVPHPRRTSSAYWLETNAGSVLLDCAPSAIHRMAEYGLNWPNLDAIWISHFHLDHFGGLLPFLFGTKYAPETQARTKPMTIFGPVGLSGLFASIDGANKYRLLEQPFEIGIVEVEPLEGFELLKGIRAVTFDTPHTPESSAIRIEDEQGASMVFSSDTGFEKALGGFARTTDLLLLECSFVKDKPVEKHLELAEAVYLARYSKARRTVLTHLYPEWDEVNFDAELAKMIPGCEIIQAHDGDAFVIDPPRK